MQHPTGLDPNHHTPDALQRVQLSGAIVLLLVGVVFAAPAYAEEATEKAHGEGEAAPHKIHAGRNQFMGFAGWSHKDSGKDSVTLGMEYTYRFSKYLGVGGYIEVSEGQFKADTLGISFGGAPTEHLYLFVATGTERTLFEEQERLLRAGLSYGFPVAGVELKPLAWVDFVAGHKIYFLGFGVEKRF